MNFTQGSTSNIPFAEPLSNSQDIINDLVFKNKDISKKEWDSFETSWDFQKHPF